MAGAAVVVEPAVQTESNARGDKRAREADGSLESSSKKPLLSRSDSDASGQSKEENPRPFTVVLTGGPCSGKSSVLAVLKRRLSVRGFQVLTIPENATHFLANSDGFQPDWAGTDSQAEMQRIFLDFQLDQERGFHQFAALNPKPAVLLLDRSVMDCKVFISDDQWEKVLNHHTKPKLLEEDLLKRYDLVLHMVTCAEGNEGKYEWGPESNNPGRYHTPEQAREQDQRCLEVYRPHPQLRVVPSLTNFEDKVDAALTFLNDALHIDGLVGKRTRVQVQLSDIPKATLDHAQCFLATSTYLDSEMQHCVRKMAKVSPEVWQERFRELDSQTSGRQQPLPAPTSAPGSPLHFEEAMYEKRVRITPPDGQSYLTRKMISEYEYTCELTFAKSSSVHKFGLTFVLDKHYYELFFFPSEGQVVLDRAECAPSPPWITQLCDAESVPTEAALAPAPLPSPARSPTPVPGCEEEDAPVLRTRSARVLMRHTTEEAASTLTSKREERHAVAQRAQ
jgi:hypothetical protein